MPYNGAAIGQRYYEGLHRANAILFLDHVYFQEKQ